MNFLEKHEPHYENTVQNITDTIRELGSVISVTNIFSGMYPYFLFAAIHHLIVPDFLCPTS